MTRKFAGLVLFGLFLISFPFVVPGDVDAVSERFPDSSIFLPSNDSDNGFLEVSKIGAGNSLEAPRSSVYILYKTTGLKGVIIFDGKSCEAPQGHGIDYIETQNSGSYTTDFQFYSPARPGVGSIPRGAPRPNTGSCSDPDIQMSITVGNQDAININGVVYYVVELRATALDGIGGLVNAFRVISEPESKVVLPQTTGASGTSAYFAIQRRPGQGSGDRTFALYMSPDCSLPQWENGKEDNATFSFYDDDHGASFEVGNPPAIKIERKLKGTGNWSPHQFNGVSGLSAPAGDGWRSFTTANGGSGTPGSGTFRASTAYDYRVLIRDVSGENGIRFTLPFTEAGTLTEARCTGPTNPPADSICTLATPQGVGVNQNDNVAVQVQFRNTGQVGWDGNYQLSGPGIAPGSQRVSSVGVGANTRVFSFTLNNVQSSQVYSYRMSGPSGVFGGTCTISFNVNSRPQCYIRGQGGGTNATIYVSPTGGTVTIDAQILNPGVAGNWGDRYFMTEEHNGVRRNLGYLTAVVPGAFTGVFTQTYNVTTRTTFNYEVWVVPPPGAGGTVTDSDLNAFKRAFPPPAIPVSPSTGIAAGTTTCPIVVDLLPSNPVLGEAGANCRDIYARINWSSGIGTPITVRVGVGSDNGYYRETGNFNISPTATGYNLVIPPFQAFPDLPLHNSRYGYNIFAYDSTGRQVDIVRDGVMSTSPCITMTCNPFTGVEVEPGDPISSGNFGGVTVTNQGYRASNPIPDNYELETRITGGVGAPPNSRFRMPIRDGTAPVGSSSPQTINTGGGTITAGSSPITITTTVYFNGVVFTGVNCPPTTIIPVTIPYLKAYGGDVIAGAKFTGTESLASPGGVRSYIRVLPEHTAGTNRSGSGSQLGVFSWGSGTTGFVSAALRAQASQGNYLTFARASSPSTTTKSPTLGLQLTRDNPVLPNYFEDTVFRVGDPRRNNGTVNPLNINNVNTNEQTVYGGSVTLSAAPNYSKRHTVYVNGDVYINGNIAYNEGGYAVIANIPNFTLVARGNIYIDNDVTALSGTYIAQPKDSSTGKIYTCASGPGAAIGTSQIKTLCGTKLTVKGSLIAANIVFNRSNNTLRDSKFKEARGSTTIAEEITFSPDVYLSPPVFRSDGSASSGTYDSISTLPPIL